MTGVVTFDPAAFKERYPEFDSVSDSLLTDFFNEATLVLENTRRSLVKDVTERRLLLWMLTAHLTQLFQGANGQGSNGLVGRVSSASEGTVSVSADMGPTSAASAWYWQTQYGAAYWNATAKYRQMRYVKGQSVSPTWRNARVYNGRW